LLPLPAVTAIYFGLKSEFSSIPRSPESLT